MWLIIYTISESLRKKLIFLSYLLALNIPKKWCLSPPTVTNWSNIASYYRINPLFLPLAYKPSFCLRLLRLTISQEEVLGKALEKHYLRIKVNKVKLVPWCNSINERPCRSQQFYLTHEKPKIKKVHLKPKASRPQQLHLYWINNKRPNGGTIVGKIHLFFGKILRRKVPFSNRAYP